MNRDPFEWVIRAVAIGAVVLLAACGSSPPSTAPASAKAPRPTLAQERQRLADLFEGTPVVLAIDRDGSLRAEVPLKYSFDPGRAVVKPPLGALLDRLAGSRATRGGTWAVEAPGDPKSKGSTLALERAASVRDYLVGKGADALHCSVAASNAGSEAAVIRVVVKVPSSGAPAR